METAYLFLRRSYAEGYNGGSVALDTGLGKTIICLAVVATIRLVELSYREVMEDRNAVRELGRRGEAQGVRKHSPPVDSKPCPSGDPLGIQCCCTAGSLSYLIATNLGRGPTVCIKE